MTLSARYSRHHVAFMFRGKVLRQSDRCAAPWALGVRCAGYAVPREFSAGLDRGDRASRRVMETCSRHGRTFAALTAEYFVIKERLTAL
jgi:hypothetical protein